MKSNHFKGMSLERKYYVDMNNLSLLSNLVRELNAGKHNPATSGNYSLRSVVNPQIVFVSESKIDKSLFTPENLIPIYISSGKYVTDIISDVSSEVPSSDASKGMSKVVSEEAQIHFKIYQVTGAQCVLHSHFLESLLICEMVGEKGDEENLPFAEFTGLEMIKAFSGFRSHLERFQVPILENSQVVEDICKAWHQRWNPEGKQFGFLIRGHGLYCWGASISEAKRHLEAFEYLIKFEVYRHSLLRKRP